MKWLLLFVCLSLNARPLVLLSWTSDPLADYCVIYQCRNWTTTTNVMFNLPAGDTNSAVFVSGYVPSTNPADWNPMFITHENSYVMSAIEPVGIFAAAEVIGTNQIPIPFSIQPYHCNE